MIHCLSLPGEVRKAGDCPTYEVEKADALATINDTYLSPPRLKKTV